MGTYFAETMTSDRSATRRRPLDPVAEGPRVLLVDDDADIRHQIRKALTHAGYRVVDACGVAEALDTMRTWLPDVVISDMCMPDASGMDLLREVRRSHARIPVIVLTAFGTVESAVDAMRAGAVDYLTKPWVEEQLRHAVERALEQKRLDEAVNRPEAPRRLPGLGPIVTQDPKMLQLLEYVRRVARTETTVLIEGETGTGKELIAQAIHKHSRRAAGPFHRVNCGALTETLLESELFGHEKGAFTGADRRRQGIFELAHGGTLLLDELQNISPATQMRLLRVLEQHEFMRVGGSDVIRTDVRIVATTNCPLKDLVDQGKFREDLYYRIRVVPIRLPPLRHRRDDVPLLIALFLREAARRNGIEAVPEMDPDVVQRLMDYPWPGNVRELRNLIERLVISTDRDRIELSDLPDEYRLPGGSAPPIAQLDVDAPLEVVVGRTVEHVERHYIDRVLAMYRGHLTRAAKHMGISRRTLYSKMQRYGLRGRDYR